MSRPTRPTFRPAVESLEARDVPTTLIELTGIAQQPPAATGPVVTVTRRGPDLVIVGTPQDDSVTVSQVGRAALRLDIRTGNGPVTSQAVSLAGIHRLIFVGGDGNDTFVNRTAFNSLAYGGNGDDVLIGGAGKDQFDGGAGDDDLRGGAGNDILVGGTGNNKLDGGSGINVLNGVVTLAQLAPDTTTPGHPGNVRGLPLA